MSNPAIKNIINNIPNNDDKQLLILSCEIGTDDATTIGNALLSKPNITSLHIARCTFSLISNGIFQALLQSNTYITTLSISEQREVPAHIGESLATLLQQSNASLTSLNFNYCSLEHSAVPIFNSLRFNTSVSLIRVYNGLDHLTIGPPGTTAIANSLPFNKSLVSLSIYDKSMGSASKLARALLSNSSLKTLELQSCAIDVDACQVIGEALKSPNCGLSSISLADNVLGSDGASAVINSLSSNHSVTQLSMIQNNIGGEVGPVLARVLAINTTISKLILNYNEIGDGGAEHIANALSSNTTVTYFAIGMYTVAMEKRIVRLIIVFIGYNKLSDKSIISFAKTLSSNNTLKSLSLDRGMVSFHFMI